MTDPTFDFVIVGAGSAGCAGWSWREVLPWFLRAEDNRSLPPGPLHGRGGPLAVSTPRSDVALCDAPIAAGPRAAEPAGVDRYGGAAHRLRRPAPHAR